MDPGFVDPAVAALPTSANLYYGEDLRVATLTQQEMIVGYRPGGHTGQSIDNKPPPLMFGGPEKYTSNGEAIVDSTRNPTGRGHVSEILNFHGSPAPWILIGILIVAGILHLSGKATVGGWL